MKNCSWPPNKRGSLFISTISTDFISGFDNISIHPHDKTPHLNFFSYQGVNPLLKGHLNYDLFYLRIFCRWEFQPVIVSFHHSLQIFGQYCQRL